MVKAYVRYFKSSFSLVLIAICTLGSSFANANITGLAVQEKLRVPVFYAATSGYPPKDLATYIADPLPFKMEARYIVDRFSARRNNQLWLNAILRTNSREELKQFEDALLQFSKLIKIDMFKGDRLVFDLNPVRGTSVSINDVPLGTISNLNFQTALVSIWFGDKQPSKKFAEQIRTAPTAALLKEFNALTVQTSKNARLRTLQASLEATPEASQSAEAEENSANQAEVGASEVVAQSGDANNVTAEPTQSEAPQQTVQNESPTDSNTAGNVAATTAQATASSVTPDRSDTKQASADKPAAKTEPKPATTIVRNETQPPVKAPANQPATQNNQQDVKVAKVEEVSVVDQMFASLRNDYSAELKLYIEQNARPVPPRKVRRKPKGNATLRVTLFNSEGKLLVRDSEKVSGEFEGELLQSMYDSIERLQSMPPIPEAIADLAITIDVTLDFAKCKRSTSAWICF
ncbi:hypothetical protein FLL45_11150 [Aliikangiella marina]|uniref:Chalcone isomerase domain-containing protein n=1 Tax=Aliikangiella marina TaxID=1712262 RepID=A0A545TE23_9GAMM|nr:chalcone isomerase family protein [Aliikangiella marina]TQV75469.1 hypothetical protein FLL45_11150 [Aliikangiella marina]